MQSSKERNVVRMKTMWKAGGKVGDRMRVRSNDKVNDGARFRVSRNPRNECTVESCERELGQHTGNSTANSVALAISPIDMPSIHICGDDDRQANGKRISERLFNNLQIFSCSTRRSVE